MKKITTTSEAGKKGAESRWSKVRIARKEVLDELSKYVSKVDLNFLQANWKTEYLERLLKAYKHEMVEISK